MIGDHSTGKGEKQLMNGTAIGHDIWTGKVWRVKAGMVLLVAAVVVVPLSGMTRPELPKEVTVAAGLGASWVYMVGRAVSLFLIYIAWRVIGALLFYPSGSGKVFGATTGTRLIRMDGQPTNIASTPTSLGSSK